jgi:hypothetical protein
MPIKFSELNPRMKRILTIYPVRNRVKCEEEDDKIILIYPKDFSGVENWLHKRIGGPDVIKRPLDEVGSKIWRMCDGKHTVNDICSELDEIYHEDIEPVLDRVSKFLEILIRSNLIRFSTKRVFPKKLRVIKKQS